MSGRANTGPDRPAAEPRLPPEAEAGMPSPRLPPVTEVGMLSLALIVAGGIYLASHIPRDVPLGPAIALLALSAGLLVGNLLALSRVDGFNWPRFLQVARWSLLAYATSAGLIAYTFIRNDLTGGPLVVLSLSLVVYAVHVPMLIGFTVARYDDRRARPEVGGPGIEPGTSRL